MESLNGKPALVVVDPMCSVIEELWWWMCLSCVAPGHTTLNEKQICYS